MVSSGPVELPNFWEFAYIHLQNNERERFSTLRHVNTDRGKTRSLIRATLNEHSLDRYVSVWLADPELAKSFEPWALMRDQEASPMLSSMAVGLNSILFALSIDNVQLNAVRLVRDVAKPEPIIAAPTPPSAGTSKKKSRQIIMDQDDDIAVGGGNGATGTPPFANYNILSTLCLLKEEERTPPKPEPSSSGSGTPSQVYNVREELPSEIQSIVCRSEPTKVFSPRMTTSLTSEPSARTELFPDPPTSSSFIYPTEQQQQDDGSDGQDMPAAKEETSGELKDLDPSVVPSEDGSSMHSSAVSLDAERLRCRLRDTEERCQYLEARVAELSLENHRLKGMTNSPRGGLTFFTVSVPRAHLEGNKYFVYEIQITPTHGGDEWAVRKRYRDFYALHQTFQKTNAGVRALDFPPKKKFGNMVSCKAIKKNPDFTNLIVFLGRLLCGTTAAATASVPPPLARHPAGGGWL